MKGALVLLIALMSLISCSNDGPLTGTECRTMAAYAESLENKPITSAEVAQCISGNSYTRSDYKCVMKVVDEADTLECLAAAGKRG